MERKYSKNVENFIMHIKHQCKILDVDFQLTNFHSVYCGDGSSQGYFEAPSTYNKGMLKVGTGFRDMSDWVLTLAHEYAHMLQWFNRDPIFENFQKDSKYYAELEIKTEREALKLLKKFNIKITKKLKNNSNNYIKKIKRELKFKKV